MKKLAGSVLVAVLAAVLTLASVIVLIGSSFSIAMMTNPAKRALATAAELLAGVFWLLGTTYVATRLAVLIFDEKRQSRT
jgi:cytochrome c biogenesis protein CcdA